METKMKKITLSKEIEVKREYDVIVCGGGVAGVAAAITVAEQGKSVLLIEKSNILGGLGTLGLIKAVNSFNPERNIKLATYASRCIENEILMQLRKSVKTKCEISFDEPLNVDWDGNELLLSDVLGSDADVVCRDIEEREERGLLRRLVSELGEREREIIELRYGLRGGRDMTQKEVADALGISQSYISRLEKKIIAELRGQIAGKF